MGELGLRIRLWGGMHFRASVPDGAKLCHDIGNDLFHYFYDLQHGRVPDFQAELVTTPGEECQCEDAS